MSRQDRSPAQISMFDAFAQAEQEARTQHLPGEMVEAIAYFQGITERFHAALMRADLEQGRHLVEEAHELAFKLNGGTLLGILGDPDAPGCRLQNETAAPPGQIPLYGQCGSFIIDMRGMQVRIDMDGIFSVGSQFTILPGFSAHAVDWSRSFLSETGYRSFLGYRLDFKPATPPDQLTRQVIASYVDQELKGKLRRIDTEYLKRHEHPQPP